MRKPDRASINKVEEGLKRLTKSQLIHLVETTNCARDFLVNFHGEVMCGECQKIGKRLGLVDEE